MSNKELFSLMVDLAAALYAAVNAGKLNEADIINQEGIKEEIGALIDRAESAMIDYDSFSQSTIALEQRDPVLLPINPADHPEGMVMQWSEMEIRAIKDYAARCIDATLSIKPKRCRVNHHD